jgi:hypothetical protein
MALLKIAFLDADGVSQDEALRQFGAALRAYAIHCNRANALDAQREWTYWSPLPV